MSETPAVPRWRVLFTPRWLSWHAFAIVAFAGMLWLGDWQFRRAIAGNTLSWAYTFEWPIFAIFGAVFWVKTVRDELRPSPSPSAPEIELPAGARTPGPAGGDGAQAVIDRGQGGDLAAFQAQPTGARAADGDGPDESGDLELAEYNAYLAMLSKEVKRHGKWHGLR
jgi:hypothetical protein